VLNLHEKGSDSSHMMTTLKDRIYLPPTPRVSPMSPPEFELCCEIHTVATVSDGQISHLVI
jgi:hypothetical protein